MWQDDYAREGQPGTNAKSSTLHWAFIISHPKRPRPTEFPDRELMARIVRVHHPTLETELLERALKSFFALRDQHGLRKKPSTSELIDWIAALRRAGLSSKDLDAGLPFLGVLLKREQDILAMAERQAGGRGRG